MKNKPNEEGTRVNSNWVRERILLNASATIFLLFAVAYLIAPDEIVAMIGISLTQSGSTDIRATYGGLQAGIAIFLFWSARSSGQSEAGLLALLSICGSVAVFRAVGVATSGELGLHYIGFLFEIPLALLALIALRRRVNEAKSI